MALAPKLELRTSQSLVMTQQLQQSIKLLQMNAQELQAFVDNALEENPFLSADDDMERPDVAEAAQAEDERDWRTADDAPAGDETGFQPEEWHDDGGMGDGSQLRLQVTQRDGDGEEMDFGDSKARDITLREHLIEQLQVSAPDLVLRRLGMHLIDLVDDAGYIKEDLAGLADQLGTDEGHIEQALGLLQSFDPTGVCARNLQECLTLQLKERDRFDPAMQVFVEHLHLLADGNLEGLKRRCNVDAEDLKDMIAEIRGLNPKPGLSFQREIVQPVEPDVTVRRDNTGQWHVELNTSALPKVLVNRRYYAKVASGSRGGDKKYVTEKMQEANWLIKAMDQRANTILKVASSIVSEQEGFFRMGIHHLRPLTLKDIARETGFHESTVSRVTTGKYMITPRGTFELKYFFTSGVSHRAGGEDVSSETVKHLIKELIDREPNDSVLSDDELAEKLKAQNINVARRTVAKYREALGIASSMQRRRQKASL